MAISERIKIIVDVVTGNSKGELGKLRGEVASAEGAMGKLRAGGSAAFDGLKANIGTFAVSAGAALVAFGVKAVGAFQELALAAGKMADATGISTEAASRWIEVAGDVGVEAKTVEGAMLKMEKAAASTPDAFADLGVEMARTGSGALDANETFLRVIERLKKIPDPAARSAAATKILGKSWADMAEIIESNDIRGALESVSEAKVIDAKEIAKARQFRESMDELKGTVEDLTLKLGEELVPVLAEVASAVADVAAPVGDLTDKAGGLGNIFNILTKGPAGALKEQIDGLSESSDVAALSTDEMREALAKLPPPIEQLRAKGLAAAASNDKLAKSVNTAAVAAEVMDAQYKALLGTFSDEQAWLNVQDGFDETTKKIMETVAAAESGSITQEQAFRTVRGAVLDLKTEVANYAQKVKDVPPRTLTEINAAIDEGDIDRARWLFGELTKTETKKIQVNVVGDIIGTTIGGRRAAGGPVSAGRAYEVGEGNRPELFKSGNSLFMIPGNNGQVLPNAQSVSAGAVGGAGGGVTVNVSAGLVAQPAEVGKLVVEAIEQFRRRNGSGGLTWLQ